MTKPKRAKKSKKTKTEEEKQFDELIGALLKVPPKKPKKRVK